MTYKVFNSSEINNVLNKNVNNISLSEESVCACLISFMTGIKELGTISFFDINAPQSFGLDINKDVAYSWEFDKNPISDVEVDRPTGVFLSSNSTEYYKSSTNDSYKKHTDIYEYTKGYLYRDNSSLQESLNNLRSTSDNNILNVIRLITLRRDLFKDGIEKRSLRFEVDTGTQTLTGSPQGTLTSLTTSLDIKNPYYGKDSASAFSFFGVPWRENFSLDTATGSLSVEAVIRPYKKDSIILYRRLSSENWKGSVVSPENSFIKLELSKSPDNRFNGFRFYIRQSIDENDVTFDFSKENAQASGFFIPDDVGINLFDGKFHHIAATWSISGLDGSSTTGETGYGQVFGYIDGYKLENKEVVSPNQFSSDGFHGPSPQVNMYKQKIPVKNTAIQYVDTQDDSPSGNNLYIGISNLKRNNTTGDRGDLSSKYDINLAGGYDGQIQHLRIWSKRLSDGSNEINENVNLLASETSDIYKSLSNIYDNSITSDANLRAWWYFNELNTLTADDISTYSNTGSIIGNGNVKLYNRLDTSRPVNAITEESISSVARTCLYLDRPDSNAINNDINQGRIIRERLDNQILFFGMVYYDLGFIALDRSDTNVGLNFIWPSSGHNGNFGFNVYDEAGAFNFQRFTFDSYENSNSLFFDSIAEGDEFNNSENITVVGENNSEANLDKPITYITSVGLYNDFGELLAIGKLSLPAKKDESIKIIARSKIDF